MPNEFNIKNGFITSGNSNVYANLTVTGILSITSGLTVNSLSATTISATTATIRRITGGSGNTNSGTYSFIGGGQSNCTIGNHSVIGGGFLNRTPGSCSYVGGGCGNCSAGFFSTVSGGRFNTSSSSYTTVAGGQGNTAYGGWTVVGGGLSNCAGGSYSFVGGGCLNANTSSGYYPNDYSVIVGGSLNSTQSSYYGAGFNFVGAGFCNRILNTNYATISGGQCNTASGQYSVIGGGRLNTASGTYSVISGGLFNTASGSFHSIIGGGRNNTSSNFYTTVGGGRCNVASGSTATVSGGYKNIAGGNCSFVGGGQLNIASGSFSSILAGSGNTVTGNFSSAIGCGLNATAACSLYTNNIFTGTISATTFTGNSLTLSNSASTISLNNTTRQQIRFYAGGTGTPTYTNYSAGAKIIFSDNIGASSAGYAIGVDVGSLWYGVDLAGNGHDWYAGTNKLASLISSAGFQLFGLGSITTAAFTISGTSSLGSKGGLGYMDFLRVYNNYPSATNPNKWFRTTSGGTLQILRDDYGATIFDLTNGGIFSVGGGNIATATSQDATSNYLSFNSNNTQIYDDGNTHIHSRGSGQAMWINTNGGQLNLLTQTPTATGGIGSGIAIATGTLNGYVTINTGRTVTTAAAYGYLTTAGAGTYPGGSQTISISLYAENRIWGQEIDAFSDERMKDIHGEITLEEGIKLVKNLKPIKYNWKEGDDKGVKAGYSAQQVIKAGFDHLIGLIPTEGLEETVDEDGFTSPKDTQFAMNYDQVTPYHGVVIKHLLEEIENLKNEIKELKDKLK